LNNFAIIGISIAAFIAYKFVGKAAAEQEDVATNGAPDYSLTNLTRTKVGRWSKTALIQNGYYDSVTNAPTPAFYALPKE
jgi:hypothetical protein